MEGKTADFSKSEMMHVIQPRDLNGSGRLFGGALLQMIDELAGIVAKRHCQTANVTTAAIDAYENDLLVLIGYVTYTGNTSMEVRIDTYIEDIEGMRRPINRAYFVMVAMGEDNCPTRVPPLLIETESQKAEWEGALLRRKNRLERRKAGF